MPQLKRGGKETLDSLFSKLDYIDHYTDDNPAAVKKLTRQMREQLTEEVKPYLMRAAPGLERQVEELRHTVDDLAQQVAEIKQPNVTRFRKAE